MTARQRFYCWRDRHKVVHILDGTEFLWCDVAAARDPKVSNTKDIPTCLRCVGEFEAFLKALE